MTKEKAQDRAQRIANETGSSTLVYFTKVGHKYGVSFTLPIHGMRVGERYYPQTVTDKPWDTLTPGKGDESDNNF